MSPQLLAAELADKEQAALAEADRKYRDLHGDNVSEWSRSELAKYLGLIAQVHAVFHADEEFEVAA